MTPRVVLFFAAVAACAQLPPAAVHDVDPVEASLADATVTDLKGNPIPDLTASNFTLEVDGKQEEIVKCVYRTDEPLRLAVIIDDLSLPPERLAEARRALLEFFRTRLRAGDEAAVLRVSSGDGRLDRFTSDRDALLAAVNRVDYNPASSSAPPAAFTAGTLGAIRSVLQGMRTLPGRKALLLISDRLRSPARESAPLPLRLTTLANRASAAVFAVDMGNAPLPALLLDQGIAAVARDTGGLFLDGGAVTKMLDRIAQQQAGYYVLTYGLQIFLTGAPHLGKVAVKVNRPDAIVRTRDGAFGESAAAHLSDTEDDMEAALPREFGGADIRAKLTPLFKMGSGSQIEAVVHVDTRDFTFVKDLRGQYHATLATAFALFDENGAGLRTEAQILDTRFDEERFSWFEANGFDYRVSLPVPRPGAYQLRALVRDDVTGRTGSARQFIHVPDWSPGHLVLSSPVLRGEVTRQADGAEVANDPAESGAVRSFKAGHQFTCAYSLYNLATDAQNRSSVEVVADLIRDAEIVFTSAPIAVNFAPSQAPARRSDAARIKLGESTSPGHYFLRLTVKDKLAGRSATQFTDFEVRP